MFIASYIKRFLNFSFFEITIIDPREYFVKEERFSDINIINKWPDEAFKEITTDSNSALIVLTHDPKIDDPALKILLKYNLPYIGALGSRKTHAKRCARLNQAGISIEKIQSIKGPAGLDIGAKTAGEIALSMLGEVIAATREK